MKQHTQKHNGFTLIELVVAIGLLVMVVSFSGLIFRMTIETHRLSIANGEIMQKLRAFTEQLKQDFKGVRKNGQIGVHENDICWFFSTGSFVRHFDGNDIRGNMALISYLNAAKNDPNDSNEPDILLRRQTIITGDPDTQFTPPSPPLLPDPNSPALRKCFYDWQVLDPLFEPWITPCKPESTGMNPYWPEIFMMKGVKIEQITNWPNGVIHDPGLRFKFRIHDSKGLINNGNGRVFTYIVYFGDIPLR